MNSHTVAAAPPSSPRGRVRLYARALAPLVMSIAPLAGCAGPQAGAEIARQNSGNIHAFAANARALAAASHALAREHADAVRRRARERVSSALIRIRTTITPETPTQADLSDPDAPWSRELASAAALLRARIDAAPLADRAVLATALADAHPATIDVAVATPGFDSPRVLRDAVALHSLNRAIEAEPSPAVQRTLRARRDDLLDPYMPARLAASSIEAADGALRAMLGRLDEQARIARVHAQALSDFTGARAPAPPSPIDVFLDQELRAAVLELVRNAAGDAAEARVRDRLARIDAALAPFVQAP